MFSVINWAIIISKFIEIKTHITDKSLETFIEKIEKNNSANQESYSFIQSQIENILLTKQRGLEKGLSFLASSASIVPFVGLLGTVIGIAKALKQISIDGSANIGIIAGPIGEALGSTAIGLFVAIPAGFFYNYFCTKIEEIIIDKKTIAISKIFNM